MLTLEKSKTYKILGIDISPYSKEEFYNLIDLRLQESDLQSPPFFVVTVNPEIVVQSILDNEFKDILLSSSINTADGIGISWAVKYLYGQNVERITGSDSLDKICGICAKHRQPVFFYGAMPGIAERAAIILQQRIDHLDVSGTFAPASPDLEFEQLPSEIQAQLKSTSVIFVALGAPAQEKWIRNNLPKLPNCKLIIGIGGSFDFIAGNIKRAPIVFRKTGMEWLYRLYLQPSRWRRMFRLPIFVLNILLLKYSYNQRKRG